MTDLIHRRCCAIEAAPAIFSRSEPQKTPTSFCLPLGATVMTGPPESPPAGMPRTLVAQKSLPAGLA